MAFSENRKKLYDEKPSCLRIAAAVPVEGTFYYALPDHLAPMAHIGCRVLAPFKNRKVTGYILEKIYHTQDRDLKEILEILDQEPLFPEQLVPFFEWMADYYLHPIGQIIQSALPGGLNTTPFKTATLTEKGRGVLNRLTPKTMEKEILSWVEKNPGRRLKHPLAKVYQLQKKGYLTVIEQNRKRRAGPLLRKFVMPTQDVPLRETLSRISTSSKTKNEAEFLETLLHSGPVLASRLTSTFSNGSWLIKKWVKKGVLEECFRPICRNPAGEIMFPFSPPPALYEQQQRVLHHILSYLDKETFHPSLLYGVTGSGKTEVYYRAVQHVMESGRQAIVMVPEISLAIYLEGFFRSRLGNRLALYHSRLSQGERFDQWMRMARGEVGLVIGARSALFAPFSKLGLIIVDEEYDSSYKQENAPRYQARDAALVRAKMSKALVLLGAGTPSIQSYQNAVNGKYHLLSMPDRIEKRPLPDVETVDMKNLDDRGPEEHILSPRLREAIDENLTSGNQTILFLNRRGFRSLYLCRSCGQSIRCPNCDVSLTYHLLENRLACHYCGFSLKIQSKCPSCGGKRMKPYGFGTEKLEQELKQAFPKGRIGRLDADSTRKKGQAFKILKKFGSHEIDILVGTQMITKGYDFPQVTLVGVIAADLSLGFPDFRAGERTFQILSQVAGRSGRGEHRGRVIIQTFNPDHYAIRTAVDHDYHSFFKKEQGLRRQLGYPPFSHLICLRLNGNDKEKTASTAGRVTREIKNILEGWPKKGKEILVLGPVEAPIAKLKGKYRWQVLLKGKNISLMHHLISGLEKRIKKELNGSGVHLIFDVDPYQMI